MIFHQSIGRTKFKGLILITGFLLTMVSILLYIKIRYPTFYPFKKSFLPHIPSVDYQKAAPVLSPLTESTLLKTELPFSDGSKRKVIIYLPVGYSTNNKKSFPTFYLLHGAPGTETDWPQAASAQAVFDQAIQSGNLPATLVIFPDGNGGLDQDSQYLNSADGKLLNENFIVQTLVEYVDTHFATAKDRKFRAIGGNSSGAFGALNLGLKHQDIFGEVLSFSGYFQVDKNRRSQQLIQGSQSVILGNSPILYLPRLTQHQIQIWLLVGRGDRLLKETQSFARELTKAGFSATLVSYPGVHDWPFWRRHLMDGLSWLGEKWRD